MTIFLYKNKQKYIRDIVGRFCKMHKLKLIYISPNQH